MGKYGQIIWKKHVLSYKTSRMSFRLNTPSRRRHIKIKHILCTQSNVLNGHERGDCMVWYLLDHLVIITTNHFVFVQFSLWNPRGTTSPAHSICPQCHRLPQPGWGQPQDAAGENGAQESQKPRGVGQALPPRPKLVVSTGSAGGENASKASHLWGDTLGFIGCGCACSCCWWWEWCT